MQIRAGHPNYKTMSDTPRTDEREARSEGLHDEWAFTLCRQLERELNEARDRQWANSIHSCHNECARPMCVLRRERDEWKEKAEHMLKILSDPAAVHINLLRGTIAWTPEHLRHVLGDSTPNNEIAKS